MSKKALLTMCLVAALGVATWAQQTVSGVVSSSSGEPLIGVNIIEKGTNNGVLSDLDGS